jgi:hypothetical protein
MRIVNEREERLRPFEYRSPRRHVNFPFWLRVECESPGLIPAVCATISAGGLGADVEQLLEPGTSVTLVLPVNSRPEPFIIHARVASQQGQRHGFVFVPADAQEASGITAAIQAFSGERRGPTSANPGRVEKDFLFNGQ